MKNTWHRSLLAFFFPVSCFVCLRSWRYVCKKHRKLLYKHPDMCYLCHRPTSHSAICIDHSASPLRGVLVLFEYTPLIQSMIHAIKYRDWYDLLHFFAHQSGFDLAAHPILYLAALHNTLCITHVPMFPYKENYIRWYNQSYLFAEYLAQRYTLPHYTTLTKTTHTDAQSSLTREQRLTNLSSAYVSSCCEIPSHCTTLLIVDDVLTTWSTLEACAAEIQKNHWNIQVRWLCIARHNA
jgi:predicted amidophosphoribosyltransferase